MEEASMGTDIGLMSDKKPILVDNPITYDKYDLWFGAGLFH